MSRNQDADLYRVCRLTSNLTIPHIDQMKVLISSTMLSKVVLVFALVLTFGASSGFAQIGASPPGKNSKGAAMSREERMRTMPARRLDAIKLLQHCETKLKMSLSQLKDSSAYPRNVPIDSTKWKTTNYKDWTGGFFPGQLWYMYESTSDEYWKTQAIKWQKAMEPAKSITWTHDLGFMVYNCYGHAWRLTRDPKYKEILFTTAASLDKLYNNKVGTTKSWTWRKNWMHPTIIDNMLNLELLFWAGKNGGRRAFYEHAFQHATVTQREHLRPNYTSYHVVNYDTATGKPLHKVTDQGLADSSTWARGQAWGIYGFAMSHRETKNIKFLATAKKMAEVFMAYLPEDNIPYWDYNAPKNAGTPRDASAAAIAASGMLEIARLSKDPIDELTYREYAVKLLTALSSPQYLAPANSPAILQHSTGSMPHKSEIDVSLIYADYYYVEALIRLKDMRY